MISGFLIPKFLPVSARLRTLNWLVVISALPEYFGLILCSLFSQHLGIVCESVITPVTDGDKEIYIGKLICLHRIVLIIFPIGLQSQSPSLQQW